jgi:hypothetical protein
MHWKFWIVEIALMDLWMNPQANTCERILFYLARYSLSSELISRGAR